MRKFKRNIFILFFLVCIVISFCFSVSAVGETGQCGDGVQYFYDEKTNTVYLTGSGDTYSYKFASSSPFCLSDNISMVSIEDGITSIGSYTFYGCLSLEKIYIPASIISIGASAFEKCCALEKIILPSGLTSLGEKAFSGCDGVTKFVLPASIDALPGLTFSSCDQLTEVVFLGNVNSISSSAFDNCTSLEMLHFNGNADELAESVKVGIPEKVKVHSSEVVKKILNCETGEVVEGLYCNVCDAFVYSESYVEEGNSHSYGKWITVKSATCTEDGSRKKTCQVCGNTVTETVEKGHTFAAEFTTDEPSTCIKAGLKSKHCTRSGCSEKISEKVIPKLPHTYKTVITKATLTTNGTIEEKCTCGVLKSNSTKVIFAPKKFALSTTNYIYNCKNRTPTITIMDGQDNKLVKNTDYKLSVASKRSGIGRYTVKVTFIGKYSGTKNLYFYIKPGKPAKITPSSQTISSVKLSWPAVPGAAGYTVYRYSPSKKAYVKAGTTSKTSFTAKNLYAGTEYTFKVIAYGKTGAGKVYNSDSFAILKTATKPASPKFTSFSQTTSSITVKWGKVTGADGYRVYQYNAKTKEYENIKTLTGTNYKVLNLKPGLTYKFRVKAYKKISGVTLWGTASSTISVVTKPEKPKITKLTTAKGKALLAWSNVSGESGYEVYYSTNKDSGFKKLTYKANVISGSKSELTSGKVYYFKVRAYKTVGDIKVYSSYSAVKSIKIK